MMHSDNDMKNVFLAVLSGSPTLLAAAIEPALTIISAVILPIVFFVIGKSADILLQIHFRRREEQAKRDKRSE